MNYPLLSEYIEAIKAAEENFAQLKHLRPVLGDDEQPVMSSGNFAVVFMMKDEQTGKLHAVKCFLKEQEGRAEAYRLIAEELEYVSSTFLTPIKYLDKELFVDTGQATETEFPVLLMDWVEGQTLDKYIRDHIDDHYELSLLAYQFSRLAMWLMPQSFAHGDLKPDNILVKDDGTLVLVDYDGMYVPSMKGQRARELGSPDFRHPSRTEDVFDEHIDDFSLVSILLSLKAISLQPNLLGQYGASDRLLFSANDYRNLSESQVMDTIKTMMQDPELATLYSLFILSSAQNNLSQASFRLLNLNRPKALGHEKLSTKVSEDDLANAWTDEYGAKYSNDKKRLLIVPKELNHYSVRNGTIMICDYAFHNMGKFPKIYLPNSVMEIGNHAFEKCSITNINIPNSVVRIGDYAFFNCQCLDSIIIPQSVKVIGSRAFANCIRLSTLTIADTITCIGDGAFEKCNMLSSVYILLGSKNKFGKLLPELANKFKEQSISEPNSSGIRKIDWAYAWSDKDGVIYSYDSKRLLRSRKSIEKYAIKEGTVTICSSAFEYCENLNEVSIPSSIKIIGHEAFYDCDQLEIIENGKGVTTIGRSAFRGCKNLKSINLSDCLEEIGDYAFEDVRWNSIIIPKGVKSIGKFAFSRQVPHTYPLSRLEKLRFGNRLSSDFKKIFIPESVNKIGIGAFYGYGDFSIEVDSNNRYYDSRNHCNAIIETVNNTLLIGCSSSIIPAGIKRIESGAFCKCIDLESIKLPDSLRVIGDEAFKDCERLLSIIIPNSVVSIGKGVFAGCEYLQSVTLSNNLNRIENSMFKGCVRLPGLSIPEGVHTIGDNAFEDCQNLKKIELPMSIISIGNSAFSMCNGITSISIPNTVSSIGKYAFEGCCISSILIPENVSQIGPGAFNCYSLTSIIVDQNNKHYDSRHNCNAIIDSDTNTLILGCSSSIIPDSVLIIEDSAFSRCDELTFVTIPQNVKRVGNYAFDGCTDLEAIEFLGIIESAGNHILDKDSGLPSIIVPNGTRLKYEQLLPDYKTNLFERVFIDNNKGKKRAFSKEEIETVNKAEVVQGTYTKMVCFHLSDGCQKYIPLCKQSVLSLGDSVNLHKAELIILDGEGINYGIGADGRDDIQKYIVEV